MQNRDDVIASLAEIFREHGYSGTSLSLVTERTGLGKGSLYNLFPGGKGEMGEAVLGHIRTWFEIHVFAPLEQGDGDGDGLEAMFQSVEAYFRSGRRVCLAGVFALDGSRDAFAEAVSGYFQRWIDSLAACLCRDGLTTAEAAALARSTVAGIQGALVLARALGDETVFREAMPDLLARCRQALPVTPG